MQNKLQYIFKVYCSIKDRHPVFYHALLRDVFYRKRKEIQNIHLVYKYHSRELEKPV
jgi:hypothetical protein